MGERISDITKFESAGPVGDSLSYIAHDPFPVLISRTCYLCQF
jgi:hypothetical protein